MITVSMNVLQSDLIKYFRRVQEDGEELIVTDNQVPFARITPVMKRMPVEELFADVQGKLSYDGDLLKPETEEWGEL